MTYRYDSRIRLGEVVLNVHDLAGQAAFYTEMIGFHLLAQTDQEVQLGIDVSSEVVLRLVKTEVPAEENYGLYHTAILVPDRPSLGAALRHLLSQGVALTGGADHGYSEAIYLDDLEGNGIEIYRDKPVSEWDIREDGHIIGVTEEMDANGVLAASRPYDQYALASGTIIGHVHLSVKDAQTSSRLYQRVFDLGDKMTIPTASWIASGNYHHQLAFNQWAGPYQVKRKENRPGLNYLTIEMADPIYFQATLKKAALYGMAVLEQSERAALLEDPVGIRTNVVLVEES